MTRSPPVPPNLDDNRKPAAAVHHAVHASPSVSPPAARLSRYAFETPFMLQQLTRQLQAALEALDMDKSAYHRALQQAPELVERESPPVWFLRSADFAPLPAAKRLVRYWQRRVDLFFDRAFRPLSCTGEGALDRETDLVELESGFLQIVSSDAMAPPSCWKIAPMLQLKPFSVN